MFCCFYTSVGAVWVIPQAMFAAHSSLDDHMARWLGLNQSKYQWALDDYYESKGSVKPLLKSLYWKTILCYWYVLVHSSHQTFLIAQFYSFVWPIISQFYSDAFLFSALPNLWKSESYMLLDYRKVGCSIIVQMVFRVKEMQIQSLWLTTQWF